MKSRNIPTFFLIFVPKSSIIIKGVKTLEKRGMYMKKRKVLKGKVQNVIRDIIVFQAGIMFINVLALNVYDIKFNAINTINTISMIVLCVIYLKFYNDKA